jgi:hypothetical protein
MRRIMHAAVSIAALSILALSLGPSALASEPVSCSNATLNGTYGASISGTIAGLPLAELDEVTSTGNGTFTGTGTVSYDGSVSTVTFTATYTVNSDCSGTASLSTGVTQNLVIKADGSEVLFIGTNSPDAEVLGDAKRLNK